MQWKTAFQMSDQVIFRCDVFSSLIHVPGFPIPTILLACSSLPCPPAPPPAQDVVVLCPECYWPWFSASALTQLLSKLLLHSTSCMYTAGCQPSFISFYSLKCRALSSSRCCFVPYRAILHKLRVWETRDRQDLYLSTKPKSWKTCANISTTSCDVWLAKRLLNQSKSKLNSLTQFSTQFLLCLQIDQRANPPNCPHGAQPPFSGMICTPNIHSKPPQNIISYGCIGQACFPFVKGKQKNSRQYLMLFFVQLVLQPIEGATRSISAELVINCLHDVDVGFMFFKTCHYIKTTETGLSIHSHEEKFIPPQKNWKRPNTNLPTNMFVPLFWNFVSNLSFNEF